MNYNIKKLLLSESKLCIIGMGYVGYQLACEFSKYIHVIGFDKTKSKKHIENDKLQIIYNIDELKNENIDFYIICVQTPITNDNQPDFSFIDEATITIGKLMKKNDVIIYESTITPGTTRNRFIPMLEKNSGLTINKDFKTGFSPERMQVGNSNMNINKMTKLISGSDSGCLDMVKELYSIIMNDNIHICSSFEIAEMSKLMENVKRDVNISLMNEFSIFCHQLNIDINEVIDAAKTKFNFDSISYYPGLVGGHCIGVDPYYLLQNINKNRYNDIIIQARKTNDDMIKFIGDEINKSIIKYDMHNIVIMGITFKEDCDDIRNSKVIELYQYLVNDNLNISVFDPYCDKKQLKNIYDVPIHLIDKLPDNNDCIIIAVKHDIFKNMYDEIIHSLNDNKILFDIKSLFDKNQLKMDNINVWSL